PVRPARLGPVSTSDLARDASRFRDPRCDLGRRHSARPSSRSTGVEMPEEAELDLLHLQSAYEELEIQAGPSRVPARETVERVLEEVRERRLEALLRVGALNLAEQRPNARARRGSNVVVRDGAGGRCADGELARASARSRLLVAARAAGFANGVASCTQRDGGAGLGSGEARGARRPASDRQ